VLQCQQCPPRRRPATHPRGPPAIKRPMTLCLLVALAAIPARAEIVPASLSVNTAADEDEPHITSSGLMLFYTSNAKKKFDVMMSTRAEKDPRRWKPGERFADINSEANTRSVFVTPDGVKNLPQRIYYASDKAPTGKDEKPNYDLYFVTKVTPKSEFTSEQGLHFCTKDDELHPWLTHDGSALYFSRKTGDGWRVYVSRRPKDGQFGDPVLVKELAAGFHHATLTKDGKTMYLQGPLKEGRWGLFRSVFDAKAKRWGKPKPLDDLNSPKAPRGDLSPCLSRDGKWLYFASDRPHPDAKGGLDLYVVQTELLK
jgi:WD40-like Beta Propeller Repeat